MHSNVHLHHYTNFPIVVDLDLGLDPKKEEEKNYINLYALILVSGGVYAATIKEEQTGRG